MAEKILYEYHANYFNCIGDIIPIIIGLGMVYVVFFNANQELGWTKPIFYIIAGIGGPLLVIFGIGAMYSGVNEANLYKDLLDNGKVYVIEGLVENYHCPPKSGHDTERFDINGEHFEYSYYEIRNGYHKPASNGGVITKDGQHLIIKYIEETYDEDEEDVIRYPDDGIEGDFPEGENVILYIAEIKE